MTKISEVKLGRILELLKSGLTQRNISQKLCIPQSAISTKLANYNKYGKLAHLSGNGWPPVLSGGTKKTIETKIQENPRISLRKMIPIVEDAHEKSVGIMSIKRFLNDTEIEASISLSKPLLTPRHINLRFEAAKSWICLEDEELKSIIFSDKSKFNLRYNDGRVHVWRNHNSELKSKHIYHTVKYGWDQLCYGDAFYITASENFYLSIVQWIPICMLAF